jgi:hypothetical protein
VIPQGYEGGTPELRRLAEQALAGAHPKNRNDVRIAVRAYDMIELCDSLEYWKERAQHLEDSGNG